MIITTWAPCSLSIRNLNNMCSPARAPAAVINLCQAAHTIKFILPAYERDAHFPSFMLTDPTNDQMSCSMAGPSGGPCMATAAFKYISRGGNLIAGGSTRSCSRVDGSANDVACNARH